jgi:hypothetical protein
MKVLKTQPQGGAGKNAAGLKLLVFIPHWDARRLLRKWSASLFSAGCEGAFSFPWVSPLAALTRPLNAEELKHCAAVLREDSLADGKDGKISCGTAASLIFPPDNFCNGDASIIGPLLNLDVSDAAFTPGAAQKIAYRFPYLVAGSCLVWGQTPLHGDAAKAPFPPVPPISFRAAAIANMSYRPLRAANGGGAADDGGCSFEWRIGRYCWLPPVKKRGRHG